MSGANDELIDGLDSNIVSIMLDGSEILSDEHL